MFSVRMRTSDLLSHANFVNRLKGIAPLGADFYQYFNDFGGLKTTFLKPR